MTNAELIADLTPDQLELLRLRLNKLEKKGKPSTRLSIQPVSRDSNTFPVSLAQQRLWFLDQLDPDNAAYNIAMAVRLTGNLDVEALKRSINEIVRRHESLRTSFASINGAPHQVISPAIPLPLRVINLEVVPAHVRQEEVRKIAAKEAGQPFSLSQAPLVRVVLVRLSSQEHILIVTLHHIISDGWSVEILIREVAALYEAYSSGKPSPLPELSIQYVDFAHWQRTWLQGEVRDRQLAYWKQQLGGELPALNLPTDRPYQQVQSWRGELQHFTLPPELSQMLRELGRSEGTTLFMTLLAGFKALLHRYTGQEDISVGTDVANRNHHDIEHIIGFFVNQLVLRTRVDNELTFRELLRRVREITVEAYANQDVPFDHLVEALQPERSLTRTPLYQVMFALQKKADTEFKMPGLTLAPFEIHSGTAKFELVLTMTERQEDIVGALEFNTDLFDRATIERVVAHYQALLQAMVVNPDTPLHRVPLLSEAEQQRMLVSWNETSADYPRDKSYYELFEEQAARTPEHVAAVCGNSAMTYAELRQKANHLARLLVKQGVGPETIVALLADRGLELLVSILAIFKAGGAYLPLDPRYPPRRLAQVLERSKVTLVLCGDRHLPALEEELAAGSSEVLRIDDLLAHSTEDKTAGENLRTHSSPDNLAYVIYTSGSTGVPKGVCIEHRSMVNHIYAKIAGLSLTADDVIAQTASQAFDISVWQLLTAFVIGGRVEILGDDIAGDPRQLLDEVQAAGVTSLEIVPSLLRAMLDEIEQRGNSRPTLSRLRWLIATGEALPPELCVEWLRHYPEVPIVNAYGPTECADDVTHCRVNSAPGPEIVNMPIGTPVINTQIYVLDAWAQPVPVGVVGELYAGGEGVGRGYLHDPAHTAEVFIPDGFTTREGKRLYRTGDLVRYLPDGRIQFTGRVDHQVKVRGNRIELGEVESVLRQHPEVHDAVAVVREDVPGEGRLVAYVVEQNEQNGAAIGAQVAAWETVWNETYRQTPSDFDPTFNIVGWNSSYTGEPIPADEVREWRDCGVTRILDLKPDRVLEIGCGVGLLMHRIAPFCTDYCGTDFSKEALDYLRQQIAQRGAELPPIRLLHREADDFTDIEANSFQAAILNSVSQYLPSIDYMARVVEGAVEAVAPGGFVFIGDVRSRPLLEMFHFSVQAHQAPEALTLSQLRQRIGKHLSQDKELVIDPAFFIAMKQHLPKIGGVFIQVKPGHYQNELTRFRYDVVLRIGEVDQPSPDYETIDWEAERLTLESLRHRLRESGPESVLLKRVPNARLLEFSRAFDLLRNNDEKLQTAGELRTLRASLPTMIGVEPQELLNLGRECGYGVSVGWSGAGENGYLEVFLKRRSQDEEVESAWITPLPTESPVEVKPWSNYSNNPEEAKRQRQLWSDLRVFMGEKLPDYMVPSAFVGMDALPLTPNGKVDRKALPAPDIASRDLAEVYVAPRTMAEQVLTQIWAEVLRLERVGVDDNFFELGGDSILSIQIIARAHQAGLHLTPRQIFQHPTIAELAEVAQTTTDLRAEQGVLTGPLGMTPWQHWFFEQDFAEPNHYNQAVLLEVRKPIEPELLREAVSHLAFQHDALRLRFEQREDGWRQVYQGAEALPEFEYIDLADQSPEQQRAEIETVTAARQASLDITNGPTARLVYFNLGQGRNDRLFIVIHHLFVDAVSWQVIFEDLQAILEQLSEARAINLPPKTTSYKRWTEVLRDYAQSEDLRKESSYWLQQNWDSTAPIPVDHPFGENTEGSFERVTVELTPEETRYLLREVPAIYRAQIDDALLMALGWSIGAWTGNNRILVELEGHERGQLFTELDVSRTVGMFSATYPVLIQIDGNQNHGQALKAVKEQVRQLPQGGIGYSVLRYLANDHELAARMGTIPQPEIAFTYLGQLDHFIAESSPFVPASEFTGSPFGPGNHRPRSLEVVASVVNGRLRAHWTYSSNLHQRATIEKVAAAFIQALRDLIAGCDSAAAEVSVFTPSDFEGARLGQRELDKFLGKLIKSRQIN